MSEPIDANQDELEAGFNGLTFRGVNDEMLMSIIEGTCDEIGLIDYDSLAHVSPPVIMKAYHMVNLVYAQVGPALTKRYNEL